MYPPIFEICAAYPDVQTNLGVSPTRLYPFGEAPQRVVLPYAVWQLVDGSPENYINDLPDIDAYTTQVDVYANTASEARDVAKALRDAIEPNAHITFYSGVGRTISGEGREKDTKHYRYLFRADWFVERDSMS